RQWIVGRNGDVYHYDQFDPRTDRFSSLWIYRVDAQAWRLGAVTRANKARLVGVAASNGRTALPWSGRGGGTRESASHGTDRAKATMTYVPFAQRRLELEPPDYFKDTEPVADMMTYGQLRDHIARLRASGANVVPQMVALHRKIAFPFVTVVMTLLAVP